MSASHPIRWGILGTGWIADRFAADVKLVDGTQAVAIGSRDLPRAEAFRARHGIARAYGSYAAVAEDPEVDIVYVATPHPFHAEHTLLALDAGKAVLCEKPFAMNTAQARYVAERARTAGRFCMEALWTRHFPATRALGALLKEGRIGDVRSLTANFSICPPRDLNGRWWNHALGGGALLDLGIYPVSLAHFVFGAPTDLHAAATLSETGVDAQTGCIFMYPDGSLATMGCSLMGWSDHSAQIIGSQGHVDLPDFFHPRRFRVVQPDTPPVEYDFSVERGTGLNYQIEETVRCIRSGLLESPIMPLAETMSIHETLDRIRRAIGVRYPADDRPAGY